MRVDTLEGMTALALVTGAVSSALERGFPERSRASYLSRARWIDWAYWPFSAFVSGNITRAVTLGAAAALAFAAGYRGALDGLPAWAAARSDTLLGALPFWAQMAFAIVVGDLVDYWNHRLRHTRALWPFHAVHHGPAQLDWLSSQRMHPVDDLCDNVLVGLVLLASGVSLEAWLATGPFLFFFNAWLHANLKVRLGPLKVRRRDARVPSLAPRRGVGRAALQLRGRAAALGPRLRHVPPARRVAARLRRGRDAGAGRAALAARVSFPRARRARRRLVRRRRRLTAGREKTTERCASRAAAPAGRRRLLRRVWTSPYRDRAMRGTEGAP